MAERAAERAADQEAGRPYAPLPGQQGKNDKLSVLVVVDYEHDSKKVAINDGEPLLTMCVCS